MLLLGPSLKNAKKDLANPEHHCKGAAEIFAEELQVSLIDEADRHENVLSQNEKEKNSKSKVKSKCEQKTAT